MHNIKDIRKKPDQFKQDLKNRFIEIDIKKILLLTIFSFPKTSILTPSVVRKQKPVQYPISLPPNKTNF